MASSGRPTTPPRADRRRWGRAQQEPTTDSYRAGAKPADHATCPTCGVVFANGRWQWLPPPPGAPRQPCPACRRIADRQPAGVVNVRGGFAAAHEGEIRSLISHQEAAEKQEHPLNRLMAVVRDGEALLAQTTDIHLARRIGDALKHAYHGTLAVTYDEQRYFVRVDWSRDS